ncbi:MAG: hypothetical protein RIB47_11940 [Cyclobacteriaceae bacterium]
MNRRRLVFLRMSALMLIATAFTTLVAHLVDFPTSSFEEQVLLFRNWKYLLRNDIIILHCSFVIVSMLGLGLLEHKRQSGWISMGFLCFLIFGIAEIVRMTLANTVVTDLRVQYYHSTSELLRADIHFWLQYIWPKVGSLLFLIFIVAFSLGCICYGIAFVHRKWVGLVFIIWGVVNLIAFGNEFIKNEGLGSAIEFFSSTYQPLARLFIGLWFWSAIPEALKQTE